MEFANAFFRWFWDDTPPVTRTYILASSLVSIAIQLEFLSPFQLYYNPTLIFRHYQVSRNKYCTRPKWTSRSIAHNRYYIIVLPNNRLLIFSNENHFIVMKYRINIINNSIGGL